MTYTKQTYKIKAKKPYPFIGSKIRGMFGYALKDEVCINPTMNCEGCFAAKECLFYELFEAQNTTQLYRLDFKLYDDEYKFSLLLFGKLQKNALLFETVMRNALRHYKKVKVKQKTKKFKKSKPKKDVIIELQTPLRIKKHNRYLRDDIDLLDILLSIHRRYTQIEQKKAKKLRIEQNYTQRYKKLYYKQAIRRSHRQNKKLDFGGVMGEILVKNIDKKIYKLLKIGEITGVGKQTTFGLGKIKIKDLDE